MSKKIFDLDFGDIEAKPLEKRGSVAFLLGAGFSIPMGYPTGYAVNRGILDFDKQPVAFSHAGELVISSNGEKPDFGYTNNYDKEFHICKDLIEAYSKTIDEFDYEQFMDVLCSKTLYTDYAPVFEKYKIETGTPYDLSGNLPDIYSQMVAYLLKDAANTSWYEGMPTHIGPYHNEPRASYNSFLQYLSKLKSEYVVNIHTLNHDLFMESFNRSECINGDLSDGFDDYGSRYYGQLHIEGRDSYRCRLETVSELNKIYNLKVDCDLHSTWLNEKLKTESELHDDDKEKILQTEQTEQTINEHIKEIV